MNDPLFGNKIAGALLTALLLFFGLPQLANALFGGHSGGHGEAHFAYPVALELAGGGETAEAPVADLATLLAAANPAAGARRAALCKSCHTFDQGGADITGPNLWDVVGREVATHGDFNYSAALKDFGGQWSLERLDHFIENSQGYVPGTKMIQRFANPKQRAEILAYLNTLSDNPAPLPAPVVAEEPGPADLVEDATNDDTAGEDATSEDAVGDNPAASDSDAPPPEGSEDAGH